MKGVLNSLPALPGLTFTWDVGTVLKYLETMSVSTLLQISCKVSMLFLPLSAQRRQTIHTFDLSDIKFVNDKLVIAPSKLLNQTKPGKHFEPLTFKRYTNEKLCIVTILSDYLERTRDIRICLFVLRLNVPVNNFSVMSGRSHRFLGN